MVDKVGRPDIDQFEAVMERENRQRGYFVAFGYTSDAEREAVAFYEEDQPLHQAHHRPGDPRLWRTCGGCGRGRRQMAREQMAR